MRCGLRGAARQDKFEVIFNVADVTTSAPSLTVHGAPVRTTGLHRLATRAGGRWRVLAGIYLGLALLASRFPLSGDDWAWGGSLGIERFRAFFVDYNGRYLGNLAVLALTRTGPLTPLVVAATILATLWLVVGLTGHGTSLGYLVALVLFLGMPQDVWREAVVWLSGFTNYAFAALGMLVLLNRARVLWFEPERRSRATVHVPLAAAGGFAASLFMENVTLYLVAATVGLVVAHLVARRAVPAEALGWLVGTVAGAAAMFSNGAYRAVADGTSTYQRLGPVLTGAPPVPGRPTGLADKVLGQISGWVVGENSFLNLALVVLVCCLAARAYAAGERRWSVVAVVLGAGALALTYGLRQLASGMALSQRAWSLSGLSVVLVLALVLVAALALVRDPARRAGLVVCAVSVVVLAAPLAVVTPVGPRCFYPTYVLFLGIVLLLLAEVLPDDAAAAGRSWLAVSAAVAATALLGSQLVVYGLIHHVADARLAKARRAVAAGATKVVLDPLPFRGAVHDGDPTLDHLKIRFKDFYGLPADLDVRVRPYRARRTVPPAG